MQDNKFSVSLELEKSGEMIYFSQLDLSLILQRSLRRTNLPNYFTQGFRPHIKISFQGALKLGKPGKIRATFYFKKKLSLEKVITELNAQLPEGLKVREISE
ncbi:MAG: TIGR03936 family radical SAM-associated protein [Candidatus Omnitrophica bacterium]|nr:TIGR03936 family radical SAM-associated protein [Candidatus Omnitrophota bacterium]